MRPRAPLIRPIDEIPLEALPEPLRSCHACGGRVVNAAAAKPTRRGRRMGLQGVVFTFCGDCNSMDLSASMTKLKHQQQILGELDAMVQDVNGWVLAGSRRPN